jgi:hypothetical protein
MAANDELFHARVIRRMTWLIAGLGGTGAVALAVARGPKIGFGFLVGAGVSYLSFWRWEQVVQALGPEPKRRSSWTLAFRIFALAALAYVIIRFLGFNLAAALAGLLVSAAAVILEMLYELVFTG